MKISYTKHALKKFKDLARLRIVVSKKLIHSILKDPLHIDKETDYPKIVSSGKLDSTHILRVVYKTEDDIITVITFYPTSKRRYLK